MHSNKHITVQIVKTKMELSYVDTDEGTHAGYENPMASQPSIQNDGDPPNLETSMEYNNVYEETEPVPRSSGLNTYMRTNPAYGDTNFTESQKRYNHLFSWKWRKDTEAPVVVDNSSKHKCTMSTQTALMALLCIVACFSLVFSIVALSVTIAEVGSLREEISRLKGTHNQPNSTQYTTEPLNNGHVGTNHLSISERLSFIRRSKMH